MRASHEARASSRSLSSARRPSRCSFRENAEEDPSGYKTLKEILGNPNMDEFKSDWESYVLKLRFR